jgi:L-lactate dehydrogenase (cytochrome)
MFYCVRLSFLSPHRFSLLIDLSLASQPSNHSSIPHRQLFDAALSDQHLFFQLYVHRDRTRSEKQLEEAKRVGFKAVVVTVDVPVAGNRELDLRTGLSAEAVDLANPGGKVGEKVLAVAETTACVAP